MALTAPTVSPAAPVHVESEVSLARLYVLRAMYLLLVIGGAIAMAKQIKRSVRDRCGLVVSVGVATNKLCAKVGSDLRKPDGLVIVDYKSSDVTDQKKADQRAKESLQLKIYALAARTGTL